MQRLETCFRGIHQSWHLLTFVVFGWRQTHKHKFEFFLPSNQKQNQFIFWVWILDTELDTCLLLLCVCVCVCVCGCVCHCVCVCVCVCVWITYWITFSVCTELVRASSPRGDQQLVLMLQNVFSEVQLARLACVCVCTCANVCEWSPVSVWVTRSWIIKATSQFSCPHKTALLCFLSPLCVLNAYTWWWFNALITA